MHLRGIALDIPVPRTQHLMVGEGAHRVGDAQLLVKVVGVTAESLEQFTPLDTTNSRDSLDDILPMMNKNHVLDQVDTIIEVDLMVDDDPIVDATMQTMQINTQGDVQEGRGLQLWQPLVCFGEWVFLVRKHNHMCNMATTKHYLFDEPFTIDEAIKLAEHKEWI
jgi:hypothetical protein